MRSKNSWVVPRQTHPGGALALQQAKGLQSALRAGFSKIRFSEPPVQVARLSTGRSRGGGGGTMLGGVHGVHLVGGPYVKGILLCGVWSISEGPYPKGILRFGGQADSGSLMIANPQVAKQEWRTKTRRSDCAG